MSEPINVYQQIRSHFGECMCACSPVGNISFSCGRPVNDYLDAIEAAEAETSTYSRNYLTFT